MLNAEGEDRCNRVNYHVLLESALTLCGTTNVWVFFRNRLARTAVIESTLPTPLSASG
jgi:hypothetical protein